MQYPSLREFTSFETATGLKLPEDLKAYFNTVNTTAEAYDKDMFCFYSFPQFQSVETKLKPWKGIPDYSNIVNTLENHTECFVFADYMIQMFTYAIRLNSTNTGVNEIYIICGDKHKVIATSFSGFMNLYEEESIELFFNE